MRLSTSWRQLLCAFELSVKRIWIKFWTLIEFFIVSLSISRYRRKKKARGDTARGQKKSYSLNHIPFYCVLFIWGEKMLDRDNEIFINTIWLTYSGTFLHCVVVNVTSNAFISGLICGLKFTNHKLAGKFIGGDLVYDGHADVILVPRDSG